MAGKVIFERNSVTNLLTFLGEPFGNYLILRGWLILLTINCQVVNCHPLYLYSKASMNLKSFPPMVSLFMVPGPPPSVSSQEPPCGLSTHCSSSHDQLCPRPVFHFPRPSHGGRSLAEGRGTLPRPRGLGLCRTRSQKNLCAVSERCESFHRHVKDLTFGWNVKKKNWMTYEGKKTVHTFIIRHRLR